MKARIHAQYACPTCNRVIKVLGPVPKQTPGKISCPDCGGSIYTYVDRRGRVHVSSERSDAWDRAQDRYLNAPGTIELPIIWTPARKSWPAVSGPVQTIPTKKRKSPPSPGGRIIRNVKPRIVLAGSFAAAPGTQVETGCNCRCGKHLTSLVWDRSYLAGRDPLVGIVVLDAKLKERRQELEDQLGPFLRRARAAVALLVCRACKADNVFVLRGHAVERPMLLDELLTLVDT